MRDATLRDYKRLLRPPEESPERLKTVLRIPVCRKVGPAAG